MPTRIPSSGAKLSIIAPGSRGDVQPYVALGVGLHDVGHRVDILTHRDFQPLVEDHGLNFVDLGGSMEEINRTLRFDDGNPLGILRAIRYATKLLATSAAEACLEHCHDSDMLLSGAGGMTLALAFSEKFSIPLVQLPLYPMLPTREFSGVLTPRLEDLHSGAINLLSHRATLGALWRGFAPTDTAVRRGMLGMEPTGFLGPFRSSAWRNATVIHGYSSNLVPRPFDWPSTAYVSGYWFLDERWTPDPELVEFLAEGPAPVYVGYGSASTGNPRGSALLAIQALARSGQRGVLSRGWGGMEAKSLPDGILMVDYVPHSWLFPRMAAVVHSAGCGVAAAGMLAGVPTVPVPFLGDQRFWARKLRQRGIATEPIEKRRLTVDNLSQAIALAVSDPELREQARRMREKLLAENGVEAAVDIIQERLSRG
jgi:UDP:flavonoid glycosyltransferase YjiC (YdhE family)